MLVCSVTCFLMLVLGTFANRLDQHMTDFFGLFDFRSEFEDLRNRFYDNLNQFRPSKWSQNEESKNDFFLDTEMMSLYETLLNSVRKNFCSKSVCSLPVC